MTTKSYSFWLTDAEMAKAKDSHIPDTFIPQIAKHLFVASISGENQQEAIAATLKAIFEANQLLVATLEKIPDNTDETIQQKSIPQFHIEKPYPEQIKDLLAQYPSGLTQLQIMTALSISQTTAIKYLIMLEEKGIIGRKKSGQNRSRAYVLRGANNE